jgi:pimeloyl-ACP methyl ester carboxylesterase
MNDDVVLVHGVWMPGAVMTYLKQHLERDHGFRGHLFSYASVRGTLDENAELLADFVSDLGADNVHLVGHSLGGVVSLRMLALNDAAPPGRVVCLGSPLCGCRVATSLSRHSWGSPVLGKALVGGVLDDAASRWAAPVTQKREIGIIAGTHSMGIGRLLATFDEDCDGTVAVSETRLPGARDHVCMHVSHMGLTMSRAVADQAAAFLEHGRFTREGSGVAGSPV